MRDNLPVFVKKEGEVRWRASGGFPGDYELFTDLSERMDWGVISLEEAVWRFHQAKAIAEGKELDRRDLRRLVEEAMRDG